METTPLELDAMEAAPVTSDPAPRASDLSWPARITLATLSLGAAVIHFAMVPPHAAEWLPLGIGFALAGWFQVVFAIAVIARPSTRWLQVNVIANLAFIGVWAVTRTVGLPVGPEAGTAEAVSIVDGLCVAFEAALVLASGLVLVRPRVGARLSLSRVVAVTAIPALAVAAMTTAALASPAGGHAHEHGNGAATADHDMADHDMADHDMAGMDHDHGAPVEGETASSADHTHAADAAEHAHADDPLSSGVPADHDMEHANPASGTSDHDHDMTMSGDIEHKGSADSHMHTCDSVTPNEQEAADDLVATTQAASAKYEDFAVAQAEGYVPITPPNAPVVHYGNMGYMTDGKLLDPNHIESLMFGFDAQHHAYFLGSMYLNDDPTVAPPTPGGCLTMWHDHTNLCLAPGRGMVGVVRPDGTCPPGSTNEVTSQMIHVWSIPLPDGPLSHEAAPADIKAAVLQQKLGA